MNINWNDINSWDKTLAVDGTKMKGLHDAYLDLINLPLTPERKHNLEKKLEGLFDTVDEKYIQWLEIKGEVSECYDTHWSYSDGAMMPNKRR